MSNQPRTGRVPPLKLVLVIRAETKRGDESRTGTEWKLYLKTPKTRKEQEFIIEPPDRHDRVTGISGMKFPKNLDRYVLLFQLAMARGAERNGIDADELRKLRGWRTKTNRASAETTLRKIGKELRKQLHLKDRRWHLKESVELEIECDRFEEFKEWLRSDDECRSHNSAPSEKSTDSDEGHFVTSERSGSSLADPKHIPPPVFVANVLFEERRLQIVLWQW